MSSKYVPPAMKSANIGKIASDTVTTKVKSSASSITKFLPFICAGAAVGVSILALKELKKFKLEMVAIKKQQIASTTVKQPQQENNKKIEQLEDQLKRINLYLATSTLEKKSKNAPPTIIKNVMKPEIPKEVKIINNQVLTKPEYDNENVEYEEIEVTDDDSSENEHEN